jgi:hypothetical protein
VATKGDEALIQQPHHRRGNKRIQFVIEKYREAHPGAAVEPHLVSPWALGRRLIKQKPITPEEQLARKISRELRAAYFVDPQGREVRANHAVFYREMTPGGPRKRSRWLPLFDAPPKHMLVSAQLRRRQAVADVMQLRLDLESYNENNIHGAVVPIPDFDLNKDIEELRQSVEYLEEPLDDEDDDDDEI